ncbi:nitroreductase family protein [Streptococcus sobrinus]|uniref:Nitroreductase domain-containing protein n=1 Tax=Streptococcus sobrinus W1703 TaxID=1227275 RepID=U2KWA7_9STRE|nr:nitroreductase family protein [Streptococcus sobrinus]ERJ79118.1 hypothetical protein HMPREF1557_00021 [Streptococcus sobrinus W1703]
MMLLDDRYFVNKKKNYNYLVKQNLRDAQNYSGWLMNFAPTGNLNLKFETEITSVTRSKNYWDIDTSAIKFIDDLSYTLENRCSTPVANLDSEWSEKEVLFLLNKSIGNGKRGKVYQDSYIPLRNYPSGGAQYPIKLYLVMNKNIDFFKSSRSYEIHPDLGIITEVEVEDCKFEDIFAISHFNKETSEETKKLSFAIIMNMNLKHSFKKYKYYSKQLAMLEAGHIAQNLQLVSTGLGKKSLPNGGILSDFSKKIIGLEGSKDDIVVYGVTF